MPLKSRLQLAAVPDVASPHPLNAWCEPDPKCDLELLSDPERAVPSRNLVQLSLEFEPPVMVRNQSHDHGQDDSGGEAEDQDGEREGPKRSWCFHQLVDHANLTFITWNRGCFSARATTAPSSLRPRSVSV
ncbi:MAG: hypothetical protein EOL89_06040 [Actinobacteria bacterium]|nr:hypothetical protein [Actinomycetota bacterium]